MVVESVAAGQDQPTQSLRVAGGNHLSDGAAAVVADQDDLLQIKGVEEVGDQTANPGGGQVGVRAHRGRVGAERQFGTQAAEFAFQEPDHRIPEVGAHEVAVEEDNRDAAASFVIVQSAMWKVNGGHLPTSKL
jgi:hypothetical protein